MKTIKNRPRLQGSRNPYSNPLRNSESSPMTPAAHSTAQPESAYQNFLWAGSWCSSRHNASEVRKKNSQQMKTQETQTRGPFSPTRQVAIHAFTTRSPTFLVTVNPRSWPLRRSSSPQSILAKSFNWGHNPDTPCCDSFVPSFRPT